MKKTDRSTNPAWLPAGAYLGLAVVAAIAAALLFWWKPKQEVRIGDPFSRAQAVLVEADTGKVVYGDLELQGAIEGHRFNPSAPKFSGSLTLYPVYGVLSAYETDLDISLSANEPTQPEDKAIFFSKDRTAFCFGPVLIEDWYATDIGQYYIIASAEKIHSAKAVLDAIPNAPDLTGLLDDSPIALGTFSPDSGGGELTVVNCGEETYNFGRFYLLEQYSYEEQDWIPLEYVTDETVAWPTEALPVEPGQQRTLSFDWQWLYGTLPEGRYRLVTYASPQSDPRRSLAVSVEFKM